MTTSCVSVCMYGCMYVQTRAEPMTVSCKCAGGVDAAIAKPLHAIEDGEELGEGPCRAGKTDTGTCLGRCARWAQHSTRGGRRSRRRELVRLLLACQCECKELRLYVRLQESMCEFERTKAFRISCQYPAGCIYPTWRGWPGARFTVRMV